MFDLTELNDETYKDVVANEKKVAIEFYSPTCKYCQKMSPVFEEIAEEMKDTATFYQINVEENQGVVQEYNVLFTPTFAFFKDGRLYKKLTGLTEKDDIISALES